ncbi:S1 family peptidase [Coraliomargarita parva]|uniref:S1 family peptidase n=1 Tax=Coraliomargarita parva TaxID=3014050 RepID=UPI0022B4EF13|nr:serine protease [Coraliomargarita parva]
MHFLIGQEARFRYTTMGSKFLLFSLGILASTSGTSSAQTDPFAPQNGQATSDPFAAQTGISGNPFQEDDPLAPTPDQQSTQTKKSEHVDLLPVEKKRAVVVIEGSRGRGTGFIAKMKGVLFVVTNIHVIKDNTKLKFMTMDGDMLSIDDVYAAKGYDIAILKLSNQNRLNYFNITQDVFSNVSVGTEVLIPGNSLGDGTILQTKGSVVAVGPKLVEHNAPTFAGNSGSPVIKTTDWEVIGVDTLSTRRDLLDWFNQHSKNQKGSQVKSDVRLFGYRIDNINSWERVTFDELERQHQDITRIQTEVLCVLSAVWGTNWHYQRSDTVSRIINRYLEKTSNPSLSVQDVEYQKKLARSALYNHLTTQRKEAVKNSKKAYALMGQDYTNTINFCDQLIEYVGRYYESESSKDPFETR